MKTLLLPLVALALCSCDSSEVEALRRENEELVAFRDDQRLINELQRDISDTLEMINTINSNVELAKSREDSVWQGQLEDSLGEAQEILDQFQKALDLAIGEGSGQARGQSDR